MQRIADRGRAQAVDGMLVVSHAPAVANVWTTFDLRLDGRKTEESEDGRNSSVALFIITSKLHARRAGSW